jgi:hypothetical protein
MNIEIELSLYQVISMKYISYFFHEFSEHKIIELNIIKHHINNILRLNKEKLYSKFFGFYIFVRN